MTKQNNKLVPNILLQKTDNKYNNGGPIVNMFDEGGYDTLDEEEQLERQNILPEVIIEGYAPLRLTTYYPFVSEYPFTGHSTLDIPIDRNTWENYPGNLLLSRQITSDRISPYLTIDKDSSADDYNLITNNCADATLNYLNKAFGTNESPNLFTTPGDVRDYAINQLHGKVINNNDGSDTVLIPRNANNARKLSTTALDMYADGDLRGDAIMKYQGPFNYTRPYVNRKSEGGELSKPLEWDKLSIRERAAYIRDAVSRGIFDIDNIRQEYNEFKKGGNTQNPPQKYIYDELPRLLREAGLDVKVSSGYRRAGAVGTAGNRSWHPRHGAVDIVPQGNTTFEDIEYALHNNPAIRQYMLSNNFGLLDESGRTPESKATMHRTGATGPHFHIGRDSKPAALYRQRVGALQPTGDRKIVYFTNPSLPLSEPEQVIEPTVVEPQGIDNSIPSQVLEQKTVPEEQTVYEQEIPEVVVTPERKLYIRPDQMLAQMNEMVTPYTPIEYNTQRPLSAIDRLAQINNNRVTLLQKDLEDAIIRNNLLGIQNPDKLRRDAQDIRFYRNMSALGGNLFPKGGPMIKVNPGDRVFTDQCALWSNSLLRDNGYLINGNAWNLNNVDTVFNGYEGLERPENYDLPLVKQYNHSATDNVFKNFDSKILDVNKPYVVNMFYNNSPSQEEAYNNGKGVTGTHTGVLTFDPDTNRWWVTHNIHGNIHQEPFVSLQNGKGKYGVTAIYAPRKDTLWNRAKGLLGFADGGQMNPIEYMHQRFPVTEQLDIHPLFDSGFTPRDIGDFGDIEYMQARYDNLPYYNNYSKPDSLKGKSVIVYNDRLGEGTNEAIALDALSHGLREQDSIWREQYIPTLLTAFREDANYFADQEGIPQEYRQEYIDGFIDGKIRDMVVKDSLRKQLNYQPKQSLIQEYRSMTPEQQNALTEAYSYIFPTQLDEIIVNGKRK